MSARRVSFVSLGCPKALVDSENIITELLASGYDVVAEEEPADVLVVNTCGFIDSAKEESYGVIEQALQEQREVVVTGCLGADAQALKQRYPQLRYVSGPAQVAPVVKSVDSVLHAGADKRTRRDSGQASPQEARQRLTPPHYAYLKISEGCNHDCSFCIIPAMRGPLRSRRIDDVVAEAQLLVADGARELLLIAQDLSAYGVDLRYADAEVFGRQVETRLLPLCEVLADIAPWVRLHYVYPYPNVDKLIPLMASGGLLPYLDVPLQHASPRILKAMRRPAAAEKSLQRIQRWREICPQLAIRSTFIVGFPGETEEDVGMLLDFLTEAQLDRVGCFTYSEVAGAAANRLDGHVDERDKLDRQEMVYELQANISAAMLDRHVGTRLRVLVDEAYDAPGDNGQSGVVGRTMFDAPEIDGVVYIDEGSGLQPGDFAWVRIDRHDDHDLYGTSLGKTAQIKLK